SAGSCSVSSTRGTSQAMRHVPQGNSDFTRTTRLMLWSRVTNWYLTCFNGAPLLCRNGDFRCHLPRCNEVAMWLSGYVTQSCSVWQRCNGLIGTDWREPQSACGETNGLAGSLRLAEGPRRQ